MTDLEAIRAYWSYADAREGALLHYIDDEFDSITDEIQGILNRFQRIELSGNLSRREVETLHRKIRQWKESGFTDSCDMKLYLRDLENRSRIKGGEALFIWLFAAMLGGYRTIAKRTETSCLKIAQHVYKREFEAANVLTQNGTMKPVKTIAPLLNQPQPNGDTFYSGLYNDAQYRANRIKKIAEAQKQQDIVLDIGGADYEKALQAQKAWMLRPSKPSAGQPNNYAGYIDMTMSFIVGHTVAQAFMDAGVEQYQFIATVDDRTTDACRSLNRIIFDMKDLKLGINAPPVYPPPHPCRSIIRAVSGLKEAKSGAIFVDKEKSLSELSGYTQNRFGFSEVKISGLSSQAVDETFRRMEKVLEDFPQLKGFIKKAALSNEGLMSAKPLTDLSGVTITFNPKYYKSVDAIRSAYKDELKKGNAPKGTTWKDVGVHELGHAVQGLIIKAQNTSLKAMEKDWNYDITAHKIIREAYQSVKRKLPGVTLDQITRGISNYAAVSPSEAISEAFADYYANGNKANMFSKAIMREIKEWL